MNLQQIKKDVEELRSLNSKYDTLMMDKKTIDLKLGRLKHEYDQGKVGREIFSEHNNRLVRVMDQLRGVRKEVIKLTKNIDKNAR